MSSLIHQHLKSVQTAIEKTWDDSILPALSEYIKIPNKSPAFDAEWEKHGYMDKAMQIIVDWCKKQPIKGMKLEVLRVKGRTPLLFIDIPGQSDKTIMLYGHMDKQPEMTGWAPGLEPWKPVLKGDHLYGRGSSDDGYSVFSALTAIAVLQQHQIPHGRCIVLVEASEESGSFDLPPYMEELKDRIGQPDLVIALDAECGNYDQMWLTTSLRGLAGGKLEINVLETGMHSGTASGVVPSPFMILRQLLDRIENSKTGEMLLKDLQVSIPEQTLEQTKAVAEIYGDQFYEMYPLLPGVKTVSSDLNNLLMNRNWRPELSVTGIDGFPATVNAGNVTVANLAVQLSVRLPPTLKPSVAMEALKKALETDPPFQAKVTFTPDHIASGCVTPPLSEWLATAANEASTTFFNNPLLYIGGGGCIPFIRMLVNRYPNAEFIITGVLGPKSNAHGPNEFLHIPTAKKITGCVASIIASHYEQTR